MCLLLIAYHYHPRYTLVVGANRDEFHDRPTSVASFWPEAPNVLAGMDLKEGGTWLGIHLGGRFAGVTNFRQPQVPRKRGPSRGHLVRDYLLGNDTPVEYISRIVRNANAYNGFSLIVGDLKQLAYYSNMEDRVRLLGPGLYGLSNHVLDTPWPKVKRTKAALQRLLTRDGIEPEEILSILLDPTPAPDNQLPRTGLDPQWERTLSPPFVISPTYGTRSSTVILVEEGGLGTFEERSFSPQGAEEGRVQFSFKLDLQDAT